MVTTLVYILLELCSAVLLCKLVKFYRNTVSETIGEIQIFAWTDLTVPLSLIRTSPHLHKTFIANRDATIQDIMNHLIGLMCLL